MRAKPQEPTATPGARGLLMITVAALVAWVASAWAQEPARPKAEPAEQSSEQAQAPAQPAADSEEPAPGATRTDAADVEAPRRFIPSQKSTADNSATFPIDI